MLCPFCEMDWETTNHSIWRCRKSKQSWTLVENFAGIKLGKTEDFSERQWIARCNLVFNKKKPVFQQMFH